MSDFITQLAEALKGTMVPDNNIRKQAEDFIQQQQRTQPLYASSLLKIASDANQQDAVQQAAAIQLGTLVEHHWKWLSEEQAKKVCQEDFVFVILHEEDKQNVRENIVKTLYEAQQKVIIKQLQRCIVTMSRYDFPEKWPSLFQQDILTALNSQNEKGILTGLQALFALTKKYEFELEAERQPLHEITGQCYPILGALVDKLIGHQDNETALEILHLIVKIFFTCNQLVISPSLKQPGAIDPWMILLKNLLDRPVPKELMQQTEDCDAIEDLDKNIHWRLKAITSKTAYRIFSKYGNPKFQEEEDKEFSEKLLDGSYTAFVETYLAILFKRNTEFVGSKTINYAIKFLSQATKQKTTMAVLVPHVTNILQQIVIPVMKMTHKDVRLFTEDPIEFIRKQDDFTMTLYTARHTIVDLLQYICMYKPKKGKDVKPEYLHPFLAFVAQNLQEYSQQQGQADWRIKEALLSAIGALSDQIDRLKELRNEMEPMLIKHVLPELQSSQAFLRRRACLTYADFSSFKLKDNDHIKQAVDGIYQNLNSQELPVRLAAATTLSQILKKEVAEEFVKPHLKSILEIYLKLMDEIDSEELVGALEEIMRIYKDDVAPFAMQICEQLSMQYKRLLEVEDDDGESQLAAMGCVSAIRRVLDAVADNKILLKQLFPSVLPLIQHGITIDGMDIIEDVMDCLAIFLYHGEKGALPAEVWALFPQLLALVGGKDGDVDGGFAFEYLEQAAVPIQNYIGKDPDTFLTVGAGQDKTYIALLITFIQRVLVQNKDNSAQLDGVTAMRITIAVLENLNGRIDEALPIIMDMLKEQMEGQMNKGKKAMANFTSMILQTYGTCFHYNSVLAFQILEKQGFTGPLFAEWSKFLKNFKCEFELRRIIFGFVAIVKTPFASLPQMISARLPEFAKQLAFLASKVCQKREKMLKDNLDYVEKGGFASDDDSEGQVMEAEDDSDDGNDSAEEFKKIKDQLKKAKEGGAPTSTEKNENDDDFEDESSEDEDYDYQAGDMQLYDSAMDDVDELATLRDTLDAMNAQDQAYFNQFMSALTPEESTKFFEVLKGAASLKEREEKCRIACEALDNKQKPKRQE